MRAADGDYADARSRGSDVIMLLHETYGGMHHHAVAYLLRLSTAAKKAGARDDTEYHDPPGSKRLSFKEHWARELSAAAALGDAARIASKLKRVLRSSSHGARSA